MPRDQFTRVVEAFLAEGAPLLAAINRAAGILAWAARHQLRDGEYGPWLHRFATDLGVSDDTVERLRDKVVRELALPLPAVTQARSQARLAAAARQLRKTREDPIEIGSVAVTSLPVRAALSQLLELSPQELAESASTSELDGLASLIQEALAVQRREALRARAAQQSRVRPTGTAR